MKNIALRILIAMVVIGFIVFLYAIEVRPVAPEPLEARDEVATIEVQVGDAVVRAEVVDTPAAQEQGLSGRRSLNEGEGMLFVFPDARIRYFWMPDMHFAIDMIWISSERRVVGVTENATPESYPDTFSVAEPVQYVLEVSAGYARSHGIKRGDLVSW